MSAWSQQPASRTARLVSNVSVYLTDDADKFMVRSSFLTTEFQAGDKRTYTGWYGHRLRRADGSGGKSWQILVKILLRTRVHKDLCCHDGRAIRGQRISVVLSKTEKPFFHRYDGRVELRAQTQRDTVLLPDLYAHQH